MLTMKTMEEDAYRTFNPALWRQRRTFILDVLQKHNVTSVLDYGCGEGSVLSFLIPPTLGITRLAGLDICNDSLQQAVKSCQPWQTDYTHLRENPLTIDIYHGSVDQYDERLKAYESIVCSEVIEHLYAPVLDRILETTLGQYQPRVMIMTTPNAEYNVNFESLQYNTPNAIFRHDDHKFEWTRQEFQSWCEAGARRYGYSVEFGGIGLIEGKRDDTSVGHCTQACIFVRDLHTQTSLSPPTQKISHQLVSHIEFPYLVEDQVLLDQQQTLQEIEAYIAVLCRPLDDKDDTGTSLYQTAAPLEWCSDWTDSITLPPSPPTTQKQPTPLKRYSSVPQQFALSILWGIPRVRQICGKESNLIRLLLGERAGDYEVKGADLVVLKEFEYEDDETEGYGELASRHEESDDDDM